MLKFHDIDDGVDVYLVIQKPLVVYKLRVFKTEVVVDRSLGQPDPELGPVMIRSIFYGPEADDYFLFEQGVWFGSIEAAREYWTISKFEAVAKIGNDIQSLASEAKKVWRRELEVDRSFCDLREE